MVLDPSLSDADKQKELSAKLTLLGQEQEERMARYRAQQAGLPYVNLVAFPLDAEVLEVIPRTQAQEASAVLFYKIGRDMRLGVVNPSQKGLKELLATLKDRFGVEPDLYVISQRSLKMALSRYRREAEEEAVPKGEVQITEEEATEFSKTLKTLQDLGQRITSLPPTDVLNAIVVGAVKVGSSDIHIEPKEKEARLRYRIDGVLQDITAFDRQGWALILSRVKVLSKLKLNIKERPQDGSFVLKIGEETYDLRVSTLPGMNGENIVMRILSRKAEAVEIKDLGMKPRDEALVRHELKRTNGMILVTGPTGSGKTTTLASFLREVNSPDLKIITLEDPIEYRIPGIEQTQVDESAGYTFAKGLRSILRQDPDMIMVGEMRDAETAETAVHASLTGHLVFSTLHTNNAAGAVPRLVDMGIKPFVLAPAINLIIAQRLVRVVCPDCAESYVPDAALKEQILDIMRGVSPQVFTAAMLKKPDLKFYKAKGCGKCAHTGYRGRVGVFEIFSVEGQMEQLVLAGADGTQIEAEALKQGMTTVAQDAYIKVIEGITTIEEVERVSEE
ncbi:MAG: type II/IV secretion system protein [Candidatus Andersenbacteria bacterium]|nr:type II/IV secretion system protein [Candidatus Andersenbacteria bacterium]